MLIICTIFDDLSKGQSPFTIRRSRQFVALAILLVVKAVCEGLLSADLLFSVSAIDADVGYAPGGLEQDSDVFIDAEGMLNAMVCLVMSLVFRYGSLIQRETDDLV